MRRSTLIIFLSLISEIPLLSQEGSIWINAFGEGIYYPFHHYLDYRSDWSYKTGGDFTYYLGNYIGFSTGAAYERKKFIYDYGSSTIYDKEIFDLKYLNIPIKLEIKLFEKVGHSILIKPGFEVGRLLTADRFVLYNSGTIVNSLDDYSFFDFIHILTFGLSYRYIFANHFFLGVCPNVRLNVTHFQGIVGDSGQGTALSYSLQFYIGYRIK